VASKPGGDLPPLGCCGRGECTFYGNCVNSEDLGKCNGRCQQNTDIRKCTNAGYPWCLPYTIPYPKAVFYQCASFSPTVAVVLMTTSDGERDGRRWTPLYDTGSSKPPVVTTPPTVYYYPQPTPNITTTIVTTPTPGGSSTNVGAIVGGAVGGGVVLIASIIAIVWLILRARRRRERSTPAGPPPIQPEGHPGSPQYATAGYFSRTKESAYSPTVSPYRFSEHGPPGYVPPQSPQPAAAEMHSPPIQYSPPVQSSPVPSPQPGSAELYGGQHER